MRVAVIIPAAGVGRRFRDAAAGGGGGASAASKLELDLAGRPVVLRAIDLFTTRSDVAQVIVAVDPEGIEDFTLRHGEALSFQGVRIVAGGKRERWETVMKALAAVEPDVTHVAVHDGARPLTSPKLIERVFAAAADHPAVIPGLPVSSTLKRVAAVAPPADDPIDAILGDAGRDPLVKSRVAETVDRRDLVEVQTPQVFEVELLRRAYRRIEEGTVDPAGITDDASLVESLGGPENAVVVVEGESTNLKITRPADAELAAALLTRIEQVNAQEAARRQLFGDDDD